PVLMTRFGLSDIQAEAILELRLRHLAKLEEVKIQAERASLEEERGVLVKTLESPRRLKKLIRDELLEDAQKYGDAKDGKGARRSPLRERPPAVAISATELTPTEPVSVVLSARGWVRAAKGHEIDPATLAFKSGDEFKGVDRGRSNQNAVFLDSTGRTYTLAAHTLPSARGLGEPLAGKLNPPDGATFEGVMIGDAEDLFLLATDSGYGFVAAFKELVSKNRAGKACLSVPKGARVLAPARVCAFETDRVAAISSQGHLLVHDLSELPRLARGKGVKILQIPLPKLKSREEWMAALAIVPAGASLKIHAGKRPPMTLKPADLEHYVLERGKRGRKLPRGFQRVDRAYASR
ncbi:MAG: DNA topoisomerase IV subunit A, partial [Gammaproteobacteria bacterium]